MQGLAGALLCACAGAAQTEVSTSQPPPAPHTMVVRSSTQPEFTTIFTSVTPQYNFGYGVGSNQPLLPTGGFWNDYMPIQVNSGTPGWTSDSFGIWGVPDAFYYEPYYDSGSRAGGCSWQQGYDSPPYWYYDNGAGYQLLSGEIIRSSANIGSVYQSGTQQVLGSGVPVYGFGAMATWDPHVYPSPPYLIGTMNYNTSSCYSGDTEYGFAHYPYYSPPVEQFYFDTNSNCSAPTGVKGSYACYTTTAKATAAPQCQGAVNLPTLTGNSEGNYWYFWYIYVSYNTTNQHYLLNAGLQDPYNQAQKWSCTYDVTANTFSNCPSQGAPVAYACPSGSSFPFPASKLYPGNGAVTVGVSNTDNIAPTGGTNPMMQMTTLYVLETAH